MQEKMLVLARPEEHEALARYIAALWHSAYDGLLGVAQVEYMTQKFQSAAAIGEQIRADNYLYFFIERQGERVGYCALRPEKEKLFLSKLYLADAARGRGLGQRVLAEVAEDARRMGLNAVYLTVNKGNARAVRAYEKFGFVRTDSTVTDIGGGYVMDDYIYEYAV